MTPRNSHLCAQPRRYTNTHVVLKIKDACLSDQRLGTIKGPLTHTITILEESATIFSEQKVLGGCKG